MNEDQINLLEKELHARLPYGIKGIASVKKNGKVIRYRMGLYRKKD